MHFCAFLWGFTAIFGKLITLSAVALVCWRMLLVCGALLLLPSVWRGLRVMPLKLCMTYAGIGVVVASHWLIFYASIKLANASVAAACIALAPAFLAFVEPLLAKRRFNPRELLIAIVTIPGVIMVVGGVPGNMHAGIVLGVIAALFLALYYSFNKRMVHHGDPLTVTCIEMGAGALFLVAMAPLLPHAGQVLPLPSPHDAVWLLALSFGCTLLPFSLMLVAMRHVSAFASQIITNLEPVYSVVLAGLFLGEQRQLGVWFYVGVVVIVGAVFAHRDTAPKAASRDTGEVVASGRKLASRLLLARWTLWTGSRPWRIRQLRLQRTTGVDTRDCRSRQRKDSQVLQENS
ncbi:membrane protein [Dyella flagellata]|uniref:Membrane protein n=2 Tax=Dyella flagellata TaxID=1867833 RepID=A0ABQ5X666_9GAMM|nr:membrane protein [Dyella flagellata]